jgi:hypothetical protein
MNSPCALSSWRSLLLLGAKASLPAMFRWEPTDRSEQARMPSLPGKQFLWLIVTAFLGSTLVSTSTTFSAQTNDSAATARVRVDDKSGVALRGRTRIRFNNEQAAR